MFAIFYNQLMPGQSSQLIIPHKHSNSFVCLFVCLLTALYVQLLSQRKTLLWVEVTIELSRYCASHFFMQICKGTMSPQAHARVNEKHFEIVGATFSNTVGEFRKLFSSVWIAFVFGKLAECFIHKRSFISNYRSCLLLYFWKLLQWWKSKNPATCCMQIRLNRTQLCMCPIWHSPFNTVITLWNRAEYRSILSRRGRRPSYVPIGCDSFARYCGKMYIRHLFPYGGWERLVSFRVKNLGF